MSGKKNRLVNQEIRDSHVDEYVEGATEILLGDDKFIGTDDKFEVARAEDNAFDAACADESAARAQFVEGAEPGREFDGDGDRAQGGRSRGKYGKEFLRS